MFAVYNGNTYIYVSNRRGKEIITRNPRKANIDFAKDDDVFYKKISDDELSEIFNIELWVKYSTGLPDTPFWWQVSFDGRAFVSGKVLLRFSEGFLPGWEIEENNVCVKYIDIDEITDAKVVYAYKKRNNTVYSNPRRFEESISKDEICAVFEKFKGNNI